MFHLIAAAIVVLLSIYIWRFYSNVRKYPKGPLPLPLVGNLLTFDYARAHEYLAELSVTYGPVFTVWLPRPYVAIMNYQGVKEAFVTKGDDFAGRPCVFPDNLFQNINNGGVIFAQGDMWKEQRKVSLQILKDFGMGKNLMEQKVSVSMAACLRYMDSQIDLSAFDCKWAIQLYVANVISHTLFGFYYPYNDCERLMSFVDNLTRFFTVSREDKLILLAQSFPFMEHLPYVGHKVVGQYKEMVEELRVSIRSDIAKALADYDVESSPTCFVHAYRQKMDSNDLLTMDQLLNVCMDFFVAGMETTSTTMRWGVLHLANNQDVQDKMRDEILFVIGDRPPEMQDKTELHYCNAVINEVQRKANLIPLNVRHRTVRDTSVLGHQIPENTIVLGQIHHVMDHSPVFDHSEEFRPERFLMDDGKTVNKETVEHLIPFSLGKRQCAGEGLAKVELFIGLVSLIQKYKIMPAADVTIDLEPIFAAVLIPKPHKLHFAQP